MVVESWFINNYQGLLRDCNLNSGLRKICHLEEASLDILNGDSEAGELRPMRGSDSKGNGGWV